MKRDNPQEHVLSSMRETVPGFVCTDCQESFEKDSYRPVERGVCPVCGGRLRKTRLLKR
jgi:rRNA maturation endonuclease Nob1